MTALSIRNMHFTTGERELDSIPGDETRQAKTDLLQQTIRCAWSWRHKRPDWTATHLKLAHTLRDELREEKPDTTEAEIARIAEWNSAYDEVMERAEATATDIEEVAAAVHLADAAQAHNDVAAAELFIKWDADKREWLEQNPHEAAEHGDGSDTPIDTCSHRLVDMYGVCLACGAILEPGDIAGAADMSYGNGVL
jgi:hypothetical protein